MITHMVFTLRLSLPYLAVLIFLISSNSFAADASQQQAQQPTDKPGSIYSSPLFQSLQKQKALEKKAMEDPQQQAQPTPYMTPEDTQKLQKQNEAIAQAQQGGNQVVMQPDGSQKGGQQQAVQGGEPYIYSNKAPQVQNQNLQGIPYDVDEKDIIKMKEKSRSVRRALELDRPVRGKVRDVIEWPNHIIEFHTIVGYVTTVDLPYDPDPSRTVIGDQSSFDIKFKDRTMFLFPLKAFGTTNLTVRSKDGNKHYFVLIQDFSMKTADFNVKVNYYNKVPGVQDFLSILATRNEMPDENSVEWLAVEKRNPKLIDGKGQPIIKKIEFSNPNYTAFILKGKFVPTNADAWYSHLGHKTTIVGTKHSSVTVRRVGDGESYLLER